MNSGKAFVNLLLKALVNKKYFFSLLFLFALIIWVSVIFVGSSKYVDEKTHSRQITRLLKGNYDVLPNLTTIPGYHYVIYGISSIFDSHSTKQFRVISLFLSLFSIWIFYLIAKKNKSKFPLEKTLQYIFLPLTFFYFPLVYTDIFSLLIVLVSFYFLLFRKFSLSALFIFLSLLIRQNNIIWALFFLIYAYVLENGFNFSIKKITNYLKKAWGFIFVFISFLIFVILNKSVAIGDQNHHQVGFYLGNIYFFFALLGLIFLPFLAGQLRYIKNINRQKLIIGICLGITIALAFIFLPPNLHEYNFKMKFLRNIILNFTYNGYSFFYALAIFLGVMSLFILRFNNKALIILPFIIICLSQSFLIEQRYSIIPVVFLLLFKEDQSPKTEYFTIFYYLILSISLVVLLLKLNIFF